MANPERPPRVLAVHAAGVVAHLAHQSGESVPGARRVEHGGDGLDGPRVIIELVAAFLPVLRLLELHGRHGDCS